MLNFVSKGVTRAPWAPPLDTPLIVTRSEDPCHAILPRALREGLHPQLPLGGSDPTPLGFS